jgi:protein-S-isoprenylcysteine O-methyltransferase Ste14
MSAPPSDAAPEPPKTHEEGALTEWLLRAFAVAFLLYGDLSLGWAWWNDPSRWTVLLLLVSETYTLLLVITARRAVARDLSPLAVVATMYAAFCFAFYKLDTRPVVPEMIGSTIMFVAIGFSVVAKMTLGRSFGILPAHRKVVLGGPYRLVRHPIYFGYLVQDIGFILVNFHLQNFLVVAVLLICQVYRIRREELFLSQSADYRDYQKQVPWRLVPFVW